MSSFLSAPRVADSQETQFREDDSQETQFREARQTQKGGNLPHQTQKARISATPNAKTWDFSHTKREKAGIQKPKTYSAFRVPCSYDTPNEKR
jgi:hypothetical protein